MRKRFTILGRRRRGRGSRRRISSSSSGSGSFGSRAVSSGSGFPPLSEFARLAALVGAAWRRRRRRRRRSRRILCQEARLLSLEELLFEGCSLLHQIRVGRLATAALGISLQREDRVDPFSYSRSSAVSDEDEVCNFTMPSTKKRKRSSPQGGGGAAKKKPKKKYGPYKCPHGKEKSRCEDCGGKKRVRKKCIHGKTINGYYCKECPGKGICKHGRQRSKCIECGGKKQKNCPRKRCPHGMAKQRLLLQGVRRQRHLRAARSAARSVRGLRREEGGAALPTRKGPERLLLQRVRW